MKTANLFLGLLLALFTITGCSSDDDNSSSDNSHILGIWTDYRVKLSDFNNQEWYMTEEPITLEFLSNKTFIDRYDNVVDGGGTWSILENILIMNWKDQEWGSEIINNEILLLNATTLRLKETFDDGEWIIKEYVKN